MVWVAKLSEWFPKKGKNMSRIAKMPIPIPTGVQVEVQKTTIKVSGPNGILSAVLQGIRRSSKNRQ